MAQEQGDRILWALKMVKSWHGQCEQVLLCADLWKDSTILHAAYGAPQEASMLNAVRNAVEIASEGKLQINESKWKYDVVINDEKQQV